MEGRRRTVSGADAAGYDMGNPQDIERHAFDTRDSSIDSDYNGSSTAWSKETNGSQEPMLHKSSPSRRHKSFYLYRIPNRTVRWLCLALMSAIILFMLTLVRASWTSAHYLQLNPKPLPPPLFESFEFLKRYHGGLRTLVSKDKNIPEYPRDPDDAGSTTPTAAARSIPLSTPFNPYPDYSSHEYKVQHGPMRECFLDPEDKVKVPYIHAYPGVPQGMPEAVIGLPEMMGLQDTMCFDRYGRFGPYGFGYSMKKGGIGAGLVGETEGASNVWKDSEEVDYTNIQWGDAQKRCAAKNEHRFAPKSKAHGETFRDMPVSRSERLADGDEPPADFLPMNATDSPINQNPLSRTAIVIRTWMDYSYTQEDILYLRSLVAELSLLSGGEYTVHFLVHMKDDNAPIWSDPESYDRILRESLPKEFAGMGTLWSERQMGLIYGGLAESFYRDLPVHGVYRSTFMPLQYFAHQHPEYDYFYNWEMDVRYTGHWYHFMESIRKWAKAQPRKGLWERSERFFIPKLHESWEEFKQTVRVQSEMVQEHPNKVLSSLKAGPPGPPTVAEKTSKPIWGPLAPEGTLPTDTDPIPPTPYEKDKYTWGIDEEADLITFLPIFDPDGTNWILAEDVTGYDTAAGLPPRRAAIVTASRLSKRLLNTMHQETALQRHTMFSEMWPATCALHHGLKAVYVPHPIYIDRNWPIPYLSSVINGGKNGATGGSWNGIFGDNRQGNLRGVSWYYNSGFAPNLWRRWFGYRVDEDGGEAEEIAGEGRMCLPAMLMHPIKNVELVVEGVKDRELDP